jgi:purine-binding chemotaxis protein CheW
MTMSAEATAELSQHLTFKLDQEIYAFDISKVREVLDFTTETRVPCMPEFLRGVINLRGSVVPVVDLRIKFGMTKTEKTVNTCVIIVEVTVDGERAVLGALADSVQEVLDIDPGQIEPAPKIGVTLKTDFMKGIGKQNDHFVVILDMDKIFSAYELSLVQTEQSSSFAEEVH